MAKILFYDLETTGVDVRKHGIHQLAAILEIDGKEVGRCNIKVAPNPKAIVDPDAMRVGNVTEEQISAYQPMESGYKEFVAFISQYVDKFDRKDKLFPCGYNNAKFDDVFLRAWFEQNGDKFFGSFFWSGALDVMILATQKLINVRKRMPDFKLHTVARQLGLEVQSDKLHDAMYDIELTRKMYYAINDEL